MPTTDPSVMDSKNARHDALLGPLTAVLDGRWAQARAEVRKVLTDPIFAPRDGLDVAEQRELTLERARHIARTSGPRLLFPKEFGGEGDLGAAITAFETQGIGDLSLLIKGGVQWGLFGGAILHLGTRRHHEEFLPKVMSLDLPGCFAMTETGHGSDVASIHTTATFDPADDSFIIDTPDRQAYKDYIGNAAAHGRMAAVFAQLITGDESHGVHCFLVPIRTDDGKAMPGIHIEDDGLKGGLNGVDNGRLAFSEVRIPRESLLDKYGSVAPDGTYSSPIESQARRFFTMLGTLVQGRISVSGGAVSATKSAMTIAVRYGDARRQFSSSEDKPETRILDYLAHQRVLLPALATTYAIHCAQSELVELLHETFASDLSDDLERRRLELLAAGIKATSTWHATRTIQACREACGGQGYLAVNRLVGLKADTDIFTTFEGDNTVLMQLVAKTLLTDFADDFESLGTIATARFVAEHLIESVIERTPVRVIAASIADAVSRRDDRDVLDREWQMSMITFRERHVLEALAQRLRSGFESGQDAFDVFNSAQDHVLLAARAHLDRVVLDAFVNTIERVTDGLARELLDRVCDLHALSLIENERGWFLEHDQFSGTKSKAVVAAVNDLCREIRPDALALVDAFAIPDSVLASPIATAGRIRDRNSPDF